MSKGLALCQKFQPPDDVQWCQSLTINKLVYTYTDMDYNKLIEELLKKPVCMMTGEEYLKLTHFALVNAQSAVSCPPQGGQKALGVHALAVELGCSDSTIYALMRTPREEDASADGGGILRSAIVSRIGRRIVFDVDTARRLADEHQKNQCDARREARDSED